MQKVSNGTYEPPPSRYTPRHQRERGREYHTRRRSASPVYAGPSRRRHRSRSPPIVDDSPPYHRVEKRSRDSSGRPKKDRSEFFQSGAGPRGGVCAICLGRHEHSFARCEARSLWDGSAGVAKKGEHGKLVGPDGLPLCYDWQLPRGCQSVLHSDRHKCAGCGKAGHGAQACPRAQKA